MREVTYTEFKRATTGAARIVYSDGRAYYRGGLVALQLWQNGVFVYFVRNAAHH